MAASRVVVADAPLVSTDCSGTKAKPGDANLILYHADCPDGFAAAFGAWKRLGDRAEYIACDHGPKAPVLGKDFDVTGKHVVVVDYCFPSAVTQRMIETAASFVVLDHHVSAQAALKDVAPEYKVFEMKQSGATLSWNYFHPGVEVPLWARYVEDKDIWRWALRDSQAFAAGFMLPIGDFGAWNEAFYGSSSSSSSSATTAAAAGGDADASVAAGVDAIIAKGRVILEYRDTIRDAHAAKAVPCRMRAAPQYAGMVVNATTLASEIGNRIASAPGVDFALMWSYNHPTRSYSCSLRSATDDCDVSLLAKHFGGGGHRRAAGFSYPGPRIEDILIMPGDADAEAAPAPAAAGATGSAAAAAGTPAAGCACTPHA